MLRRGTSLHKISQHGPLETQLDWVGTRMEIGLDISLAWIRLERSGSDWDGLGLGLALGATGLVWIALGQD